MLENDQKITLPISTISAIIKNFKTDETVAHKFGWKPKFTLLQWECQNRRKTISKTHCSRTAARISIVRPPHLHGNHLFGESFNRRADNSELRYCLQRRGSCQACRQNISKQEARWGSLTLLGWNTKIKSCNRKSSIDMQCYSKRIWWPINNFSESYIYFMYYIKMRRQPPGFNVAHINKSYDSFRSKTEKYTSSI